jgi:hypothetical protein
MRGLPIVVAAFGVFGFACSSSDADDAASRPADATSAASAPAAEDVPPPAAGPFAEAPEARNERLLKLEWACDQWWVATQKQEAEKQAAMAGLLATYVDDHFDAVVSDLRFGSPRHRRTMAAALGFSGRTDAVPPLMEALKDQYADVVQHALLALAELARAETAQKGKLPKDVVDPEPIAAYLRHPNAAIRSNAAMVLARVANPNTPRSLLLVLTSAVEDSDPVVRTHAVAALGSFGGKESFPYLVKALHDEVLLVRVRAALSLGRMRDREAAPYLVAMLRNGDEKIDVKRAAAKALREISGNSKLDTLDPRAWEAEFGLGKG